MADAIRKIFAEVPHTYERVNHLLTLGLDIAWRRRAARVAAGDGGGCWLDICSGTGEMAVYLSRLASPETRIIAADFSLPMLRHAAAKPAASVIHFALADARRLPFGDGTIDAITIGFATRNLNLSREVLTRTFGEFHRILRRRGRLVILETSQPRARLLRWLVHLYVRVTVRPIGSALSGSSAGYRYLSHTIPRFYPAEELARILTQAGFAEVSFQRLLRGVAAIHVARK